MMISFRSETFEVFPLQTCGAQAVAEEGGLDNLLLVESPGDGDPVPRQDEAPPLNRHGALHLQSLPSHSY